MIRHISRCTPALSRLGLVGVTGMLGACQILTGADDFSVESQSVAPVELALDADAPPDPLADDTRRAPDAGKPTPDARVPPEDPCAEVDLSTDPANCGTCAHRCEADEICRDRSCIGRARLATCNGGDILCPRDHVGHCDGRGAPLCCLESEIVCPDALGAGRCISGASNCAQVAFCGDGLAVCGRGLTPTCRPEGPGARCCAAGTRACFRPDIVRDEPFETCLGRDRRCEDVIDCPNETAACAPTAQPYCELDGTVGCCGGAQLICDRPDLGIRTCTDSPEECASAISCGGRLRACAAGETPNCSNRNQLVCCGGEFFFFCDRSDIGSAACWNAVADCSSVTNCNGDWHACAPTDPPSHFDCNSGTCVQ